MYDDFPFCAILFNDIVNEVLYSLEYHHGCFYRKFLLASTLRKTKKVLPFYIAYFMINLNYKVYNKHTATYLSFFYCVTIIRIAMI